MRNGLEIRRLRPEDFPGLSALYADLYSQEIEADYWGWKYLKNPAGEHFMFVATQGSRVVGEAGVIPARLKCGEEDRDAVQACDILVHPDHKKGGTFLKLAEHALRAADEAGAALTYGLSVPVTRKISERFLRFQAVCPVVRWVLVLNPEPYLRRSLGPGVPSRLGGAVGRMTTALRLDLRMGARKIEVEEVSSFDERFDRLWARRRNDAEIHMIRDAGYLNWRYVERPGNRYRLLACRDGAEVSGLVVLTTVEDELRRGLLMDAIVDRQDRAGTAGLLTAALERFRREQVDVVEAWLPRGHDLASTLKRWGFRERETSHHVIVRPANGEPRVDPLFVLDPMRWHFTMGDSDYH